MIPYLTSTCFKTPLLIKNTFNYCFKPTSTARRLSSSSSLSSIDYQDNFIKIVEVGPRDGLQNEKTTVPTHVKMALIDKLVSSGITYIEATAFVSPKWVPQMSDQSEIMKQSKKLYGDNDITFAALTPNLKGYESAISVKTDEIAVFAAASEAFSKKNINCSIEESLHRFKPVIERAIGDDIKVRAYVSCIAGCPYQGDVPISDVVRISSMLYESGCYEISLGDTIGVGTPQRIIDVINGLKSAGIPTDAIALHCHDTYGQALANCFAGLQNGIRVFDSAVSGLGGCPYAKGASGNVATEDLVYMLHGSGFKTGIDEDKLFEAGEYISNFLNRTNGSKVALAKSGKM